MADKILGTFTYWKLTDQEILQGGALNFAQKQLLQNDLATTADQILNLIYNPINPLAFVQEDANLKGYMQAIRGILTRSDEAESMLRRLAEGSSTPFDSSEFN